MKRPMPAGGVDECGPWAMALDDCMSCNLYHRCLENPNLGEDIDGNRKCIYDNSWHLTTWSPSPPGRSEGLLMSVILIRMICEVGGDDVSHHVDLRFAWWMNIEKEINVDDTVRSWPDALRILADW
nr:hypothetical protein CFP56_73784 [Quercus suber]